MRRCRGVQPFGISGPHWKKSCLGLHIKYRNTNENWWPEKKVLSKFMILCWATFTAILGLTQPTGHRLDTPEWNQSMGNYNYYLVQVSLMKDGWEREREREREERERSGAGGGREKGGSEKGNDLSRFHSRLIADLDMTPSYHDFQSSDFFPRLNLNFSTDNLQNT